jgi:hypothetical protein
MRLETLAELVIEAVEETTNDFLLAERIRELVADHKDDVAELDELTEELGCDGGACTL